MFEPALFFNGPAGSFAQDDFNYDSERQRALELFRASDLLEAKPILEKLYAVRSDDNAVLEALAFATVASTVNERMWKNIKTLFCVRGHWPNARKN